MGEWHAWYKNISTKAYPNPSKFQHKNMTTLLHTTPSFPICKHTKSSKTQCKLFTRRSSIALPLSFSLTLSNPTATSAFDFRLTVPDQTVQEAESVVRIHARELLNIKPLLDSQSWRAAQLALRESAAYLKQDVYTLIQGKPADQRASLRKLYSELFNNVSRLDYAARNKDAYAVNECYMKIVTAVNDILSRI